MKKKQFKTIIFTGMMLIFTATMLIACSDEKKEQTETTIETTKTEVQAISKTPEELAEIVNDVTPMPQKTDDELITETLLEYYDKSFDAAPYDIKSTGYKMYLIDEIAPGVKRAYGWANYWCYNIENDELKLKAGAGTTQVALEFSTDGKTKKVIYEVLTDDQEGDEEFRKIFPKSIIDKLLKRDQKDIDEVEKKQKDMAKRLYKEKTGKEYTKELNYN